MTYPLPPTAVDLTFEFPSTAGGSLSAVDLTFGATSGPPPGTVYAAAMNCRFALRGSASVNYNIAAWRGLTSSAAVPHQQASARARPVAADWTPSSATINDRAGAWDNAADKATSPSTGWSRSASSTVNRAGAWDNAAQRGASASSGWDKTAPSTLNTTGRWQTAVATATKTGLRHGNAKPTPLTSVSRWQNGRAVDAAVTSRMSRAGRMTRTITLALWDRAQELMSYGGPMYLPHPPAVVPPNPVTLVELKFCALYPDGGHLTSGLNFVIGLNPCGSVTPDATLYILPARFYMAVHSIQAFLHPSSTPITIKDVSLAADADSTAWTFSANGPAVLFDALAPTGTTPQQIRIEIDGISWVFVVDKVRQTERFGQRGAAISGRSVTAMVGAPYSLETSRMNTTAANAQQLALSALQFSGVGLDWGITDWLVPAGAWSHTGTPLAAVQTIAQAAGGFVLSHRSDPTLLVRHPYPLLPGGIPGGPWNWEGAAGAFAADVELAPDAIIERAIERIDYPLVNGVYVSGTNQGIQAHIYRQGTAGDKLAAMQVDPLITALAAATQRGYSIIGRSGTKHIVQMTIPVLTGGSNPGVLDVGQLVQINDSTPWRGRVRAVSVQASMQQVRQSFTMERHLS